MWEEGGGGGGGEEKYWYSQNQKVEIMEKTISQFSGTTVTMSLFFLSLAPRPYSVFQRCTLNSHPLFSVQLVVFTFTCFPLKSVTSLVNLPEASTGHTTVSPFFRMPYLRATRKSSSPKPGAWWTTPVPLSLVT